MQQIVDTPESSQRARSLLLSSSPDPQTATRYLQRFEQAHPETAARLAESPSGLQALIGIFSYSNFLSEELLQHPEWIEQTAGSTEFHRVLSAEELRERLDNLVGTAEGIPSA